MVAKYYALSTNDTYQEIGFTHINPAMKYNYLRIGMYNWDAMNANSLSLGNVAIAKGDEFATNGKTAYQTLYDNTAYGGTLVDINFADNNTSGITWGDFRAVDTAGSGTKGIVFANPFYTQALLEDVYNRISSHCQLIHIKYD